MYREQPPDPRLAPWVECTWSLHVDQPVQAYPVRPDGCLDLIYTSATGLQVVGAMTTERRFDLPAGARTFGIRFRPGMAAPFFRLNAAELTDCTISLDSLSAGLARRLASKVHDARALSDALPAPATPPGPVERAIEAISAAHGDIDLDWAATHAGLSVRQFRRRCMEASGLTPKRLCRILRFRRACALARPPADWAAIAAAAGYFDQSHLIRDFREFTGASPMSVFSNTPTLTLG
jgi:AraC-like DNA-binding protein